jgi:tetratricopeptide (TPR) repeat protein
MKSTTSSSSPATWQFTARFRRNAFGWRSQLPIQRVKEAVTEIRQVARNNPIAAAEGAVAFLEKVSPALAHVDSSSGAIGNAVNKAIATLVPLIAKPVVSDEIRQRWLERLWSAIEADDIPYIEYLADFWGELCQTTEIACHWADWFIDTVNTVWSPNIPEHNYFKGTIPCLASLYAAKRYQELLTLLDKAPYNWWHYRRFGVKALCALGEYQAALTYAENSRKINAPLVEIDRACEEILFHLQLFDEAYSRYAFSAHQATTNVGTFRAIVKKYPDKAPETILHDLITSQPGNEGKWFAAAKDAGFYDLATALATHHPVDPRTLIRATRDFAEKKPEFAIATGFASLHWIADGYGYDITSIEVREAFCALAHAWQHAKNDPDILTAKIKLLTTDASTHAKFIGDVLAPYLGTMP